MKSFCKMSKSELAKLLPALCAELPQCQHVCKKCGRVAVKKDRLCKPTLIAKVMQPGK
ncbi:MAG: hypothetical protein AAF483_19345 [Planctomycetota bacterium]